MKITMRLSSKVGKGGLNEIIYKSNVRVNGKVVTMRAKSEVYVLPDLFSEVTGVDMSRKRLLTPEIKLLHLNAKKKIEEEIAVLLEAELKSSAVDFTSDWMQSVLNEYLHPSKKIVPEEGGECPKTFYELASDYIKNADASEAFKRQLWVTVRAVSRYEGYRRETKNKDYVFSPEEVTLSDIDDFVSYLRNEYEISLKHPDLYKRLVSNYPSCCPPSKGRSVEKRGANVIHSCMKRFRTMWHRFNEKGLVTNDPFKGFKNVQEHYGNVTYITLEERNAIASAPMPTKHLETQRDIFIAQCRIGCRVSDLMRLTPAHIQGDMIVYVPTKTKDEGAAPRMAHVPITKGLKSLIDKYKDVDKQGRLFPCISQQNYNEAIKMVFTIAGITRQVEVRDSLTGENVLRPLNEIASSHMARRTFVANLYNKVADPTIIAQMSGHSENSTSFARYRKQEDDLLRKVAQMVD